MTITESVKKTQNFLLQHDRSKRAGGGIVFIREPETAHLDKVNVDFALFECKVSPAVVKGGDY